MRAVVQRVLRAAVVVIEAGNGTEIATIDHGYLVLVGVRTNDTISDARTLAEKVAHLRVMEDPEGKLNLSVLDAGGSVLVVSNFTLYGDCRKGRRPSFINAARGEHADALYCEFGEHLRSLGVPVQFGQFGAEMQVSLVNDGPVTLVLETRSE